MSVKALSAVWEDSRAEGSQLLVLLAMADWADHNGRCYPSYGQLARKTRLSRASVIAAVNKLVDDLKELERIPYGHAASTDDDDMSARIASQRRNAYRILLVKPKVVQNLDHFSGERSGRTPRPDAKPLVVQNLDHLETQVVQSTETGSPNPGPQVVQSTDPHIRNSPSVLTVSRPSAAAAAAENDARTTDDKTHAECEGFRRAWNDAIVDPLPPVDELTPGRRQRILAALQEFPLDAWQVIFARVARSSFLCGGGDRGFVANLWWLIEKPERALAVMEGQYDDAPKKRAAIR